MDSDIHVFTRLSLRADASLQANQLDAFTKLQIN
jgi:hypothetical protein